MYRTEALAFKEGFAYNIPGVNGTMSIDKNVRLLRNYSQAGCVFECMLATSQVSMPPEQAICMPWEFPMTKLESMNFDGG